jgi:hypothetical protein
MSNASFSDSIFEMKAAESRPVESTEDFKLRIAAIIGDAKPAQIPARPRPHPLLVRRKKLPNRRARNV